MQTKELTDHLVGYGRAHGVPALVAAEPYLQALGNAFGERDVLEVTAKDLHAFHRAMSADPALKPLVDALNRKSQRWEVIYEYRAHNPSQWLPWESERPVRALVDLLERPGFRPRRVLELGCGDGVNAIYLASRGCQVTAVDISSSALKMAREKQAAAGVEVEFVESDIFDLGPPREPYDFVFDRGMFHHVQVFHFEDYKNLVADRLTPDGYLHLLCHHVSDRPTVLLDCLCGSVGKLLGFLTGNLVETGAGFTAEELREIFSDRFRFESMDLVPDDNHRPFRFESCLLRRIA